ncbi:hypothetical protein D3C80_1749540 [compost metagenome]
MLGIKALATVDRTGGACIEKGAEEVQGVSVAEWHDEQGAVVMAEPHLSQRGKRKRCAARMASERTLRLACSPRRVHQRPGIIRSEQ